jgi:hypothetical protein
MAKLAVLSVAYAILLFADTCEPDLTFRAKSICGSKACAIPGDHAVEGQIWLGKIVVQFGTEFSWKSLIAVEDWIIAPS